MAGKEVDVAGRRLTLTNLDKVLYPSAGFTKAEVIDYYARIAPVLIPHLEGRPMTFRRFPNGVDAPSFYEKNCPAHAPEWLPRVEGPGDVRGCLLEEPAALVWAGNQAALELHALMARSPELDRPLAVVFDLDPGPPADLVTCCEVALMVRDLLDHLDLVAFPKTSGGKGLQLYVPLNTPTTYEATSGLAHAVAQLLEREHPDLVVSVMRKDLRGAKVLVDWSQNSFHKTTVAPYSLRARERPTVSTPITWDEVSAVHDDGDASSLRFESAAVLARVEELGDLFAPVLELEQELPTQLVA